MSINVNRVTLGFNSNSYNTAYFTRLAKSFPASSTPLGNGSFLICKAGGLAWFVAPTSTQLSSQWANGSYNNNIAGDKCCISEWGILSANLSACRYNPTEWFVPSSAQLSNPGFVCRNNWDPIPAPNYWSSTEINATDAYCVFFDNGLPCVSSKSTIRCVRAFRCVTY